jgi:hypothetical protein
VSSAVPLWLQDVAATASWIGVIACVPDSWRVWKLQSAFNYSWYGAFLSCLCMTLMEIFYVGIDNWLGFIGQGICYLAYLVIIYVKLDTEVVRSRRKSE